LGAHCPGFNVNQRGEDLLSKESASVEHVKVKAAEAASGKNACQIVAACIMKRFWFRRIKVVQDFAPGVRARLTRKKVEALINVAAIDWVIE
jgi:hypothetical protein